MVDTRSPWNDTEWLAIQYALDCERKRRRAAKQVNVDGVVLFSQAEQSELIRQVVEALRS